VAGFQGPKIRVLTAPLGEPIGKQIRPDDEVVVLRSSGLRPRAIGRPSIQEVVNVLRHDADLIAVAEIASMTANETKARDWIETALGLYVHEFVFRGQQLIDVLDNRKQQFNVAGGELFVGNTLVKTEGMFSLKIGGVYLLCLTKGKGGASFLTCAYPPLLVGGNVLVSNRSDFRKDYFDPLGGQTVSKIVTLLKRP
jgi:hypothetical protein